MLKRSLTKIGLGAALVAGVALLPAGASAQTLKPRLETVNHHGGHGWGGRGWGGGGHWDRGWRGYPAYGGGLGLGFYLGTAPAYNYYYGAPAYPAVPAYPPTGTYVQPAYPPAGTYTQPVYPPPSTYGTPGYPPANQYSAPAPAYPPANSYQPAPYQQPY